MTFEGGPQLDRADGFSLLELLVALAVTMAVSSGALALLSAYQEVYVSNVLQANVHAGLRSVGELMQQEVAQAGLVDLTPTTLTNAVTGSGTSQTVAVASTANMFVGQTILVDHGAARERVALSAVSGSTVTGVFTTSHAAGAGISSIGIFPDGVLSASTATRLRLLGDINADGTLMYVEYACDTLAGTFSRSSTPIAAGTMSPAVVLVDDVVANPDGTPCFRYTSATAAGFTFTTSVSLTLTSETTQVDPRTQAVVRMTKSFLSLSPRNVLAGLSLANDGMTDALQPTPPGVPLS